MVKSTLLGIAIVSSYSLGLGVSGLMDGEFNAWRITLSVVGILGLLVVARLHFPQWLRERKPLLQCAGGQPVSAGIACSKCGATVKDPCRHQASVL